MKREAAEENAARSDRPTGGVWWDIAGLNEPWPRAALEGDIGFLTHILMLDVEDRICALQRLYWPGM